MKLLVVGGAGYIGGIVGALLVEAGHDVTVLDDLSTGHLDGVPDGASFVQAGVDRAAEVLDGSYDGVLHFAAKSLVAESVQKPDLYWRTNVGGTLALLDAMREHGVRRIVFSSTAATYGAPATMPITEDTPPVPTNPYGASKLAVDRMLEGEARAYDLAAVSLRYFNVAGAYGRYGERHDPETHLIPNLLAVAAGEVPHARVFGTDYPTRDGTAVRDYLHVVDLADAHLRALDAATPGRHLVCNLGTSAGSTVREVLDAVRRITGHAVPVVESPRRPGDPPSLVASYDRARTELGWSPQRSLDSMVADAWAFRQRRAGIGSTYNDSTNKATSEGGQQ
ncbi:UDP-glucose 4-epimerase GalE [Actinopolymorpha alba]|uniref:UDP-glucose 4-epimerase GalE n=1 Tax=Actinopolymorpha alba TaxID=533267 RepID=UPI0003688998|nr:UDP-glucose 4-epimerase GalE [Actinopolymorpha alba]